MFYIPADSGYPYIAKTNPLGYATRLGFAMQQMGVGLAAWWKQNQSAILLSMLGILVIGGVVAFFTGGAALLGLAQVLMEVMAYYFMAQAIAMAKSHIKQFFELSWAGNTAEGGKALAKALAIIINEFLMEVILKKVGSVMKKVKDSIKATKTFAKVANVTKKISKAAGNLPGIKQLRGVGTKGGKYVIGIRKQMARGSKSLGDFRNKILEAFGFKRMWMERHGDEMQMWGEFNSTVLIATLEIDSVTGEKTKKIKLVEGVEADEILETQKKMTGQKPAIGEKFDIGENSKGRILDENAKPLEPENEYLRGKEHGIKWQESDAYKRAEKKRKPQGKWGNKRDLEYARQKAGMLEIEDEFVDFPINSDHESIIYTFKDGVKGVDTPDMIRVRRNKDNPKKFHGFPINSKTAEPIDRKILKL